jgi:virginiamycin A acetyltransferase
MNGPDPNDAAPLKGFPQVGYLKNFITSEFIEVGDYTYYDDPAGPEKFEQNVLYHFPFIGDKLIIGKFCAIARGATFIMNGANHKMAGFSTYPFQIFGQGWERVMPGEGELPYKGDTIVGHDVWVGYQATLMPGVTIGEGAIVASKSVVTSDVPAYSIVGGNPAKVLKFRFDEATIAELLRLEWWHWSPDRITRALEAIVGCDLEALRKFEDS